MNKISKYNIVFEIFTILCIIIVLDSIYIFFTYHILFERLLQKINNTSHPKVRYWSAILFYFILAFGIYFFLVREKKSLYYSFLFGVFIYLFYEITNYSIIESWNLQIVILDSLWGGILILLTVAGTNYIYNR